MPDVERATLHRFRPTPFRCRDTTPRAVEFVQMVAGAVRPRLDATLFTEEVRVLDVHLRVETQRRFKPRPMVQELREARGISAAEVAHVDRRLR
jgi:hypothetical protein